MLTIITLNIVGVLLGSAAAMTNMQLVKLDVPKQPDQQIALHCAAPQKATNEAVLFIHGASFPTMLAFGFRFDGTDSWMDFTVKQGRLACGLDFLGYGASSRPLAMGEPPDGKEPLVKAPEAASQISAAVEYLREQRGITRLHLVAHSWGTIPAAAYAAKQPAVLASLTLFGPVVPIAGAAHESVDFAWWTIAAQQRYQQLLFKDILPKELRLLEPAVDRAWADQFARSQPETFRQANGEIRIPAGAIADWYDAKVGIFPYQQSRVVVPVFVVYGNYDTIVDDAGAQTLLSEFKSSPLKWRLRIDHGTHVMHLERNRWSLYHSVAAFINTINGKPHD